MARTFTAGRTGPDVLATEPTLLEVLAALQNIEVDIEQQANPDVVWQGTSGSGLFLAPNANGGLGGLYVVPVGKKLRLKGISVSADGDGEFYMDIAGGSPMIWHWLSSCTQRGNTVAIEYVVNAGDTVQLGVANITTHGGTNLYYGSWWGYLENA